MAAANAAPRASGYSASFFLGDKRHDSDRKAVGVRHVNRYELDAGLLQAQQKVSIAGYAVELGNYELRAGHSTARQCSIEFGSVVSLSRLDFYELIQQLPVAAVEGLLNRTALSG